MKPFDLEAAKRGEPVINSKGNKVRILCFDLDADFKLIAAHSESEEYKNEYEGETVFFHEELGRAFWEGDTNKDYDLFMAPKKIILSNIMQRPIKFRMWEAISKQMYSVDEISLVKNFAIATPSPRYGCDSKIILKLEDIELMQFTGLVDTHDLEIYEGDIVICRPDELCLGNLFLPDSDELQFKGNIYFAKHGGLGWRISMKVGLSNVLRSQDSYEVIGNIYENPDLLIDE